MTELEKRRVERGFTQQFVADNIGVTVGGYNMYENKQRKVPKNKADLIAKLLGCQTEDIFVPSSFTVSEIIAKEAIKNAND